MPSNRTTNAAWPASVPSPRVQANWPEMEASRSLVRLKTELTEPVGWPVPCGASGADGWEKVHTAFGHLLKHG